MQDFPHKGSIQLCKWNLKILLDETNLMESLQAQDWSWEWRPCCPTPWPVCWVQTSSCGSPPTSQVNNMQNCNQWSKVTEVWLKCSVARQWWHVVSKKCQRWIFWAFLWGMSGFLPKPVFFLSGSGKIQDPFPITGVEADGWNFYKKQISRKNSCVKLIYCLRIYLSICKT